MKVKWSNCNLGKVDPVLIQLRAFSLSVGDLWSFGRVLLLALCVFFVDSFWQCKFSKSLQTPAPTLPHLYGGEVFRVTMPVACFM